MSNKRVAVYMRNPQSTKEMLDEAHAYCAGKQMEIVGTYTDVGTPGAIPLAERPTGKLLMQDAQAGKFGVVLVHSLDRLGRHADVAGQAVIDLNHYGVKTRLMDAKIPTGFTVTDDGYLGINEAVMTLAKAGLEIMDELGAMYPEEEEDEDESN